MKIVADENIPYVKEAFGGLGEVVTLPGRALAPQAVRDADILLVRSVTPVNARLLSGSRAGFVGTATIGTDHIDLDWLAERGIAFAAAPGSNANSVAEYISAGLLVLSDRKGIGLRGSSIGVVGVGNVGSRVMRKARAMGMNVFMCDPPRAEDPADPERDSFISLEDLLSEKPDFITLHVPLERGGKYPTFHLADEPFFERFAEGCIFMNTSRGAVHDSPALRQGIDKGQTGGVVLDVWENEPGIDVALLREVDLATPHIAGYSFDGKVRGVEMLYQAACAHLGVEPSWQPELPPAQHAQLSINASRRGSEDVLREAVLTVYDIKADDARIRGLVDLDRHEIGPAFDRLRKEYPRRREFSNTEIQLTGGDKETVSALQGLGFRVKEG